MNMESMLGIPTFTQQFMATITTDHNATVLIATIGQKVG